MHSKDMFPAPQTPSSIMQSLISCLSVVLLALVVLYGIDHFGKDRRVIGTGGTLQDPQVPKHFARDRRETYQVWKTAGFRGRTVVYISDGWESFIPGELIPVQLFREYPLQLYNTAAVLEREQLSEVTFLYVASMNMICRRIIAVLPAREVERIGKMAAASKDHVVNDRGVFISRQGYPRWFTTVDDFKSPGEKALVYVGASCFRTMEPEALFRRLVSSGLETDCIVLCMEEGSTKVTDREIARLREFATLLGMSVRPHLTRPHRPSLEDMGPA